jgi:protoporphyrinogen oxidase
VYPWAASQPPLSPPKLRETGRNGSSLIRDNWIYVQEPDVRVGRLQIFNNWSPYMVADPETVWLGLEYFCNESDELWRMPDDEMIALGREELHKIGIIDQADVLDGTVLRMEKTYPAYFGAYDRFHEIREFVDGVENLFLIGRNGMHRYNNQDHSMLTAMVAVDNILAEETGKANLWQINTEQEYHAGSSN